MSNRQDARGHFWEDLPPLPKEKKEVVKRVAPEATWLHPGYLPGLEEAQAFPIEFMTDAEIIQAGLDKERLLYDIECYSNYFCAIFRSYRTGKVIVFEQSLDGRLFCDHRKMEWILRNCTIVTFNGIKYDLVISACFLEGMECDQLKEISDQIIQQQTRPQDIYRSHKIKPLPVDHIDLFEVAPLFASLKTYGGRLHVPRMQDLPFHPSTELSPEQMAIVKWYCVNDTTSTGFLKECLTPQIDLRYEISNQYNMDVRSKSDAQIAEMIIGSEYQRLTGKRAQRPEIPPGTFYYYNKPASLGFQTPYMQAVLATIQQTAFFVGEDGYIAIPPAVENLAIEIGHATYTIGIGGLHSTEKSLAHWTNEEHQLHDMDVASYYPAIIINNNYYPPHLGPTFLQIYRGIRDRRIFAKKSGNKPVAESLKIVINGTYGKLGSLWSIMYAPHLVFHVTIGGQLFLLMLIEAFELAGIRVVSANTDGVMVKARKDQMETMKAIMKWWEARTGFELEGENYKALYSRDINNYIAIAEKKTENGVNKIKLKGAYANPWWDDSGEMAEKKLHKNPVTTICIKSVVKYLRDGVPLETTLRESKDIKEFCRIQSVKLGACKVWPDHTEYLGKSVRWYYSTDISGEIIRANNGHKIGKSEGGRPILQLPTEFPNDIDYDWYLKNCEKILKVIGASEVSSILG